jgi:DNA-binding response OmpR family regulator
MPRRVEKRRRIEAAAASRRNRGAPARFPALSSRQIVVHSRRVRVLIVEDDAELSGAMARRLRASGYAANEAASLAAADDLAGVSDYDLVVLDRTLPDGDALAFLGRWRQAGLRMPVIFVTASGDVDDRVAGLEGGADDYLPKPFAMEELLARVAALGRRAPVTTPPRIEIGDLVVDLARAEVTLGGALLPLRPKEFCVLRLLALRAGAVVPRADLIEHCWDCNYEPMSNVEESVVASLRRKLGRPALIATVRGAGYRLEVSS